MRSGESLPTQTTSPPWTPALSSKFGKDGPASSANAGKPINSGKTTAHPTYKRTLLLCGIIMLSLKIFQAVKFFPGSQRPFKVTNAGLSTQAVITTYFTGTGSDTMCCT